MNSNKNVNLRRYENNIIQKCRQSSDCLDMMNQLFEKLSNIPCESNISLVDLFKITLQYYLNLINSIISDIEQYESLIEVHATKFINYAKYSNSLDVNRARILIDVSSMLKNSALNRIQDRKQILIVNILETEKLMKRLETIIL